MMDPVATGAVNDCEQKYLDNLTNFLKITLIIQRPVLIYRISFHFQLRSIQTHL